MLPEKGLAESGLHEVIVHAGDRGRGAAGAAFVAGIAARAAGPVVWCHGRRPVMAAGLFSAGLDPGRVLWVEAEDEARRLGAIEEALKHGGAAVVVAEVSQLSMTASRRLQLAASESGTMCLVLHRPWKVGKAPQPTAAETRWRVTPVPAPAGEWRTMPRARWRVELLRCRGGEAASFIVEACDAAGRLAVPSELVDRPVATEQRPVRLG